LVVPAAGLIFVGCSGAWLLAVIHNKKIEKNATAFLPDANKYWYIILILLKNIAITSQTNFTHAILKDMN
jgi:hypothetical protein